MHGHVTSTQSTLSSYSTYTTTHQHMPNTHQATTASSEGWQQRQHTMSNRKSICRGMAHKACEIISPRKIVTKLHDAQSHNTAQDQNIQHNHKHNNTAIAGITMLKTRGPQQPIYCTTHSNTHQTQDAHQTIQGHNVLHDRQNINKRRHST